MDGYVRVYSPEGEAFDVTRDRADKLILQDGWTQTKPVPPVEETETPTASTEEEEAPKKRSSTGRRSKRLP